MGPNWSLQTRYLVTGLVLLLVGVAIYYLRELLGPLVIAALFAYILDPAVTILTRVTRMKRRWAASLAFTAFLAVIATIPAVFTPVLIDEADRVQLEIRRFGERFEQTLAQSGDVLGLPLLQTDITQSLDDMATQILHPDQIFASVRAITENVVWILVIVITTYYFLLDAARIKEWAFRMVPEPYLADAQRLFEELRIVWKTYLRGQFVAMFLIGVISGIAAAALGLPGALILGLVAAALALMPSVGSSVMAAVAGLVALFTESSYITLPKVWFVGLVVGVYILIHLVENYWLRPQILGHRLHLHPGVILVGVIGALTIEGALLALIIVPIISTVEILWRYVLRRLAGVPPWPQAAGDEAIYQ